MKKTYIALTLLTLLAAPAFAGTYAEPLLRVSFEVPSTWNASSTGDDIDMSVFVLPADEQARSYQGVGLHMYIEAPYDAPIPSDLSGVMAFFQANHAGEAYTIVSEEDVTVGGYPAKQITYTNTYDSEKVKGPARHREIYTYGPTNFLYNICFSSLDSAFDTHWPDAKAIVDSLQFTS